MHYTPVTTGLALFATAKQKALVALKQKKALGLPYAAEKAAYLAELNKHPKPSTWVPGLYHGVCPCCGEPGELCGPQKTYPPTSTIHCTYCDLFWTSLGYIGIVNHDFQGWPITWPYASWPSKVIAALQMQVWYAKQTEPVGMNKLLAETVKPPE